ncbi:MAG TPA: hypothetical protein VFH80_12945 [Solirubrobacteraceae bacterium]|nr:hypothetical protein [Solirubrobacteraceae bacterium]
MSAAALAVLVLLPASAAASGWASRPTQIGGLTVPARATPTGVELSRGGGLFAPEFWAGVNLGTTIPGHDPGELAIPRSEYDRWLVEMGALGVRVIRVYTLQRPVFYAALAAYDRKHPRSPLWLLQGIYLDQDRLDSVHNAYDPVLTAETDRGIREAVAALHGDANIPARRGLASGRYRTSVSRWLLGWSFGVEWDPTTALLTDAANASVPRFQGTYFTATADATPLESWIAARLDLLATEEAHRGWSRPLTFTNWVTTDPLIHPAEPLPTEDEVSVDALHVRPTDRWPAGSFASYHVYPYYPDFLSLGAESYAGYLQRLHDYHAAGGQATMITEFGVPSSYGIEHTGPLGRDQGALSEAQAGRIDAAMLSEIKGAGMAGGVLFEWADEWFKRAWNTEPIELPVDRRRLWRNPLTAEEYYGVISTDPVPGRLKPVGHGIQAAADPGALTIAVPTTAHNFTIGVDARPGGGGGLPDARHLGRADDVAVSVAGDQARVFEAAFWEPTGAMWAASDRIPPALPWQPARMLISHPLRRPDSGQQIPARTWTLGPLTVTRHAGVAIVHLPWMLLGFADPSSHAIFEIRNGSVSLAHVKGVRVEVALSGGRLLSTRTIRWPGWNRVQFTERRKASWPFLARAFHRASP